MASLLILAGVTMYAASYGGRALIRQIKARKLAPKGFTTNQNLIDKYKLAFEDPMSRREAALILGVSTSATNAEIHQAYKTLIILNHPDRGGSSYMAMKINHAKDLMLLK